MTQNSSTLEENVLTFKDLDNLIFKWETDLPEFYQQFVLQTEELQSWMFQELTLSEKILPIFKKIHELNWAQHELELDLYRVNVHFHECYQTENKILEDPKYCFNQNVPRDIYRMNTYGLAEVINNDFMKLTDLLNIFRADEPKIRSLDNTVEAVAQILQLHLQQLEDIEMKIHRIQNKLNEIVFYKQQALNKFQLKVRET